MAKSVGLLYMCKQCCNDALVECWLLVVRVFVCMCGKGLSQMNVCCSDMNILYMHMHAECVLIWDVHVHTCVLLYFRWLKQDYEIPFPLDKQPPVHMPIAYGLVDIQKTASSEKTRPRSQVISHDRNAHVHGTNVANIGFQGINSRGETSKERQCSLCHSNNEVCFFV